MFGILGAATGYLMWSRIYSTFQQQVDSVTLEAVTSSDAFGTICGLAAVLLVLGSGLALAWVADLVTTRVTRAAGKLPAA